MRFAQSIAIEITENRRSRPKSTPSASNERPYREPVEVTESRVVGSVTSCAVDRDFGDQC